MARLRPVVPVLVVAVAGGLAFASGTPSHVIAAPLSVTFGVPTLGDSVHTYGEPDINLGSGDQVFVSGPTGTGTQRSMWTGSFDAQAYRLVQQNLATPTLPLAGINDPPGGGDTEIVFDNGASANHANQGMYFSDLYALLCFRVEATHNYGATVTQNSAPVNAGCAGQQPTADRQWQTVFDPPNGVTSTSAYKLAGGQTPLIYLTYNAGGAAWNRSTDGTTYVPADGGSTSAGNLHFGNDGYPAIDQVTGKVFEAAGDGSGNIKMNIGTPIANGDLCFLDEANPSLHVGCANGPGSTANLITVATGLTGNPDSHFPVLTMDAARNLYLSWNQIGNSTPLQDQVFITAAPANNASPVNGCTTNCWNNWTTPVQVSDGLVSTGDVVNSFSWSATGALDNSGIADIAWYGSNKPDDPNTNNCVSGTPPATDVRLPGCEVWNTFFNQVKFQTSPTGGGVITGPPTVIPTPILASPHPMHYGDICGAGTGCIAQQGNRNLADFFMVRTDSTGAAEIVYDDTSNGLLSPISPCTQTPLPPACNQTADHFGAPVITVIRQNGGIGVKGTPVTLSPTNYPAGVTAPTVSPIDHLDGAVGNALFSTASGPMAGTNVPGMDLTRSQLSLSGSTLTVTMKVSNLSDLSVATVIPGTALQQYVTRWVMATPNDPLHGYTMYYAGMSCVPGSCNGTAQDFYAGPAQSSDLCSVSACFPHVLMYPESAATAPNNPPFVNGHGEPGSTSCTATPCTITINVNTADIGNPTGSSLLEEVGAYSFSASHPQVATTFPQSQADNVQLMIDGVCCYNFQGQPGGNIPEFPVPALVLIGTALLGVTAQQLVRRRRSAL